MDYLTQIVIDIGKFEFHPDEITKSTNITPTSTSIKGDVRKKGDIPNDYNVFKKNSWSLYSNANSKDAFVEDHWSNLVDKLTNNIDFFKRISQYSEIKITIIVKPNGKYPSIYIPKSMCKFAADVDSCIDVDVYE